MNRRVYYKQEYKIVITDNFYEVIDGKTVIYYGEMNHSPTLLEVWNKTVGFSQAMSLYAKNEIPIKARFKSK